MNKETMMERLDLMTERLQGLSGIALLLCDADPTKDYSNVCRLLFRDLKSLSEEAGHIAVALEKMTCEISGS